MNSWKKLLKSETENSVKNLTMSEEVKNASLKTHEKTEFAEKPKRGFLSGFTFTRRMAAFLTIIVALCVAVIPSAIAISNYASVNAQSEVLLEVNPSALFITDKKGKITDVKSMNSDADVILCDDEAVNSIRGSSLSEGTRIFIDRAARLGYIDFDNGKNTVKLTSDKPQSFIKESVETLRNYFCEKGIYSVVLSKNATVSELADKLGVSASSKGALHKKAGNLETLYGERTNDIEKAHKENVLTALYEIVKERVADILNGAELIIRMKLVNLEIKTHILNLGKDYWDIKDEDVSDLAILSSYKKRMEELIDEYAALTGGKCLMKTRRELETAEKDYLALIGTDIEGDEELIRTGLKEYFDSLTFEKFYSDDDKLVSVLKNTDLDTFGYDNLTKTPKTVKEYIRELKKVLGGQAESREKDNKALYEAERKPITSEEYRSYIESLQKIS